MKSLSYNFELLYVVPKNSPTIINAVFLISFSLTLLAISSKVPFTTFSSGQVALYITAIWVVFGYPPFINFSNTFSIYWTDKNITIEVWCCAKDSIDSFAGTGVLPSILVITKLWDTSGTVYSTPNADDAPRNELTPGVQS